MAFFKFRKNIDEPQKAPAQPESIEMMRKRAKYRLSGAAVLVLIGVIGFPVLFDKQPRPIAVDTPIEIPDRNKTTLMSIPAPMAAPVVPLDAAPPAQHAASDMTPAGIPATDRKAPELPAAVASAAPDIVAKNASQPGRSPVERGTEKFPRKELAKPDDGVKAQALLDGKSADNRFELATGRFIVQVGSFSETARAQEVRTKMERAGLKTYTQVATTKDGQRIRVRVGPFSTKLEAEKAAEKIRKLALPAAILVL